MILAEQIKAAFATIEMQINGFAKDAYRKDIRIAKLTDALAYAIKEADGWHDECRGTPVESAEMEHARSLLVDTQKPDLSADVKDARIADLERQLAEVSAPAVEQQPVAYSDPVSCQCWPARAGVKQPDGVIPLYSAPQAAEADKVREALASIGAARIDAVWEAMPGGLNGFLKQFGYQQFAYAILDLAADVIELDARKSANMAAQAPVREVPEPIRKFLVEVSQQRPEKPDYWSECGQCGTRRDQADELLEQFPAAIAREVPGWISVDERLPEYGAEVLVFQPEKECKVTALARFTSNVWDYYWDAAHIGKGRMTRPASVTHWLPLPAAPVHQGE